MLLISVKNRIEIVENESQKQAENIVLGLRKTSNAQKSVFYEKAKLYNSLSLRIK